MCPRFFLVIKVSSQDLEVFAIKLIKGVEWLKSKQYVRREDVSLNFVSDEQGIEFIKLIRQHGEFFQCGNSINIGRAVCSDNEDCKIYHFEIWKKFKIYASVGC